AAAAAHPAAWRARLLSPRALPAVRAGQLDPDGVPGDEARRGPQARPVRTDRARLMIALLASIALAAAMPVVPGNKATTLVSKAAGEKPRPVVLHFWATWCEACREEFPALRPQLTQLPSTGVGVLLISIDRPEDRQQAQKMLADFKLSKVKAVLLDAPD